MIRRSGKPAGRVLAVLLFLTCGVISANAYTLVMRDGRRVEIPDAFTVTNSTLTYEVSSGIQVTVQLSTVNIPATERANGEAYGTFMSKSAPAPAPAPATAPEPAQARPRQARPPANRSITNADLEEYRRTRVASERAYEKRRQQLGLPSREASQRELTAVTQRTQEQLRNQRDQQQEGEAYWRSRASALRTEIATNDAQIAVVTQRLEELPVSYSLGNYGNYDTGPFGNGGYPTVINPYPNYPVFGNPFPNNNRRGNRRWNRRFPRFPQTNVVIGPVDTYDYNEERLSLRTQLNELQMQRAALAVRWRELEEEARRAGAYPGWLRP
ncbi:MAG TPA: hypothetical protein VFY61_20085 [Pyrinomonadaceae bacterium]|nr:hypothetical protein [Pyrinomonadaceae bacterium]